MTATRTPLLLQVGDRVGAIDPARLHAAFEPPPDHLGTIWLAGPVVGQVADAVTTLVVLHKLPGAYEGNPIMRGVLGTDHEHGREAAFLAAKIVVGLASAKGAEWMAEHGQETTAKVFSGIATALGLGAALHNLGQL